MNPVKSILTAATFKILRPLVRTLLKHSISYNEFNELVRRVYVDVGFSDFEIQGRKQTNSRVSVLTGLSRKEVLRIKMLPSLLEEKEDVPLNRAARVIAGWFTDKEFTDETGKPLELPWRAPDTASFAELVKRYSGDITAGAIYDELNRVGAITKTDNNRIQLKQLGYIPEKSTEQKINIMGECASDLLNTLEHNIDKEKSPFFQRSVVYHNLPESVVDEFNTLCQEKASTLLLELNEWLVNKKKNNQNMPGKRLRTGFGTYFFQNIEIKENNDVN